MTDVTELLARLKDARAKATPGEWRVEDGTTLVWGDCNPDDETSYGMGVPVTQMRSDYRSWGRQIDDDERDANAALIVAAVNAVPALAAEIERLRAENAGLRDRQSHIDEMPAPKRPDFWRVGQKVRYLQTMDYGPSRGQIGTVVEVQQENSTTPAGQYQVFWTSTGNNKFWTTPHDVELVEDVSTALAPAGAAS